MNIISIANVKGGTGKTLTTLNLAREISLNNKSVLVIDNDPQSNITQILNVHNDFNLYDLYSNKKITYDDCLTKYKDNFYVITNTIESSELDSQLSARTNRESILKNKLNTLTKPFDYILIDNSPFISVLMKNALTISNYYIQVIDNSTSSLQGLNMINKVVEDIKENLLNEDIKLLGILRNRFDKRTVFTKQLTSFLESELSENLFDTIVYDSIKYKESVAMNKPIQDYSEKYAKPYNDLYKEIISNL